MGTRVSAEVRSARYLEKFGSKMLSNSTVEPSSGEASMLTSKCLPDCANKVEVVVGYI